MDVLTQTPDTALLLAKLADTIREYNDPVNQYLQQSGEYEIFNPLQATAETTEEDFPSTFWERLGIRHIISGNHHSKTASQKQEPTAAETDNYKWDHMRKDASIDALTKYLSNCSIIQFADYVSVKDAAGFWDGLFADVIKKAIDKQTMEFIFQLGDITGRRVFEVDEVLDVIGQYSKYGKVSLVMDEQEGLKLWDLLCGINYEPSPKEKFQLMFGTMTIDFLLIFYNNGVLLCTKEGQFDFAGRSWNNIHTYPHSREFFLTGYRLGLSLRLTIPHAIVLGLAVSGTYRATASIPTSGTLLTYINEWVSNIH
ncbi:MAG: hypothetical protein ACJ751_13625 [Niastella sp.]|uniref:hypothetical protein n=1 Tax=Niastella sp. TaxID=1869183 RepID=UPI00389AF7DC